MMLAKKSHVLSLLSSKLSKKESCLTKSSRLISRYQSMDKTMLITRPEHDLTTRYISKWSEKIIEVAQEKQMEIIELKKERVTKENVLGRLKKNAKILML